MKRLIKFLTITIIAGGFLSSCDDKIRELEELNKAPEFQFFRKSSVNWELPSKVIEDSAKVWNQSNNSSYAAILRVMDINNNISKINIFSNNPDVSFFVNDNTYYSNYEVSDNEEFNVAFRANGPGLGEFRVTAADDFGKANDVRFRIEFKSNKLPIPRLEAVLVNGSTKNYQLKGQNSFDRDKAIGGAVVEYEFVIDSVVIHTSQPNINHIFTIGQHSIKLRVKDNDDAWSEYIQLNLSVI
ncbi:hypothetical protein [Chryseobacterium sp. 18068]|uniref:hypothetical protein n=1 Tax=Chryseobacterium sp. 18068 TaxID=2681414 RepID=UPI001357B2F6|nr:hypothetical protein [Chryseobacterium sp. 18068]